MLYYTTISPDCAGFQIQTARPLEVNQSVWVLGVFYGNTLQSILGRSLNKYVLDIEISDLLICGETQNNWSKSLDEDTLYDL